LPGNPFADRAKTGTNVLLQNREPDRLMDIFRDDVQNGRLPQVSWIVAPEGYCEHPNWEPDFGAWYVSQVIDILSSNPDVWSRMALFITYDEEGGFFDHLVPPTPPTSPTVGRSTVAITNEIFGGDLDHPAGPYGLSIRVPMIVVSPWSRGGWVNSQLFDHTSLIRFLETRFAVRHGLDLIETNITPWRRAVVGDLTTAFDFKTPNVSRQIVLPGTDSFKPIDLVRHPDEERIPPANEALPPQEPGVRTARALPYALDAQGGLQSGDGSFSIEFRNRGRAAAVFQVRSSNSDDLPRNYTVGPHQHLEHREIKLEIKNRSSETAGVNIFDRYTSGTTRPVVLRKASASTRFSVERTSGWYDLAITVDADPRFLTQLAGHLENGEDSISDPLMGGLV
jgi:phospholipase C